MMRVIAVVSLVGALVVNGGCMNFSNGVSNVFFPKQDNSFEREGEEVSINLMNHTDITSSKCTPANKKLNDSAFVVPLNVSARLGPLNVKTILVDEIKKFLQNEAKRYKASYSATAIGEEFYFDDQNNCIKLNKIKLNKIVFKRQVKTGSAAQVELEVQPTKDPTLFKLKPSLVKVDKAKAKIAKYALLDPISWFSEKDRTIDVVVTVSIRAVWVVNDNGKFQANSQEVANGAFKLQNLELGKEYNSMTIPAGDFAGVLFPAIPRSYINDSDQGLGNFIVSILVTEYDDYGAKVEEVLELISANEAKF